MEGGGGGKAKRSQAYNLLCTFNLSCQITGLPNVVQLLLWEIQTGWTDFLVVKKMEFSLRQVFVITVSMCSNGRTSREQELNQQTICRVKL